MGILDRSQDDLEIERGKILDQFVDCAMHHPTFIEKKRLSHKNKIDLETLAAFYQLYREESGLDKTKEPVGRKIIIPKVADWQKKGPLDRYVMMQKERAESQARVVQGLLQNAGITLPEGDRLDVGASSGFFMSYMNHLEKEAQTGNMWLGVDVPDSRTFIAQNTKYDRKNLGESFKEFQPGGELPFKNAEFQLATLNYTLHHVDPKYLDPADKNNLLAQVYDRLAPGGYAVLMEDNIGEYTLNPTMNTFVKQQDKVFYPHSPGNQKTMDAWSRLLMKNGFKIIKHGSADIYNSAGIMTRDALILAQKPKHT